MKTFYLLSTFLFFTLTAASSTYADRVNYPASNCSWDRGSAALSFGSIRNTSTTDWLSLECPVPQRDFGGTLHTPAIEKAWVKVFNQNADYEIWCVLEAIQKHRANGSKDYQKFENNAWVSTKGHGDYIQTLKFPNLHVAPEDGHVQIRCILPPSDPNEVENNLFNEVVTYSAQQ